MIIGYLGFYALFQVLYVLGSFSKFILVLLEKQDTSSGGCKFGPCSNITMTFLTIIMQLQSLNWWEKFVEMIDNLT